MRILVAIDDSPASLKAVRFVGELLGRTNAAGDDTVTLFHVPESLPDSILAPGIPQFLGTAYQQVIEDAKRRRIAEGEKLLHEQARVLHAAGIPSERIQTKLESRPARPESSKVAAALAIIDEMNGGDYQVVCVGRRGSSSAQGAFPASMAEKILRESCDRTVWVVD